MGGGPSWGLTTGPGHLCPCQWLPAEVNHSVIYSKCKPAPSIPSPSPSPPAEIPPHHHLLSKFSAQPKIFFGNRSSKVIFLIEDKCGCNIFVCPSQRCNSVATLVQQRCNSAATALQQLCNSSATALQQRIQSSTCRYIQTPFAAQPMCEMHAWVCICSYDVHMMCI